MNRVTATHEAGHAVARLLTANLMDYPVEKAVLKIEVGRADHGLFTPGVGEIPSAAVCYGPPLCRKLDEAAKELFAGRRWATIEDAWRAVSHVASETERRANIYARLLIIVMGAAAESKLARLPNANQVFTSPACRHDRDDFKKACALIGIRGDELIKAQEDFLQHAMKLVQRPSIWSATNAIAFELRNAKATMRGPQVAELGWPPIKADPDAVTMALPHDWRLEEQSVAV